MKTKITFLMLLIALSVSSQTLDTVDISRYSLGLQTSVNPIFLPSGAGARVHNIDLSDGVLKVRKGYDSIGFVPGMDEFVGIYGAYYEDGQQQLIIATDSTGVGYGGIYASTKGSHTFGVVTDTFWVTADTATIADENCQGAKPRSDCTSNSPFVDSIIYGDSIWVLNIPGTHDSAQSIEWWADTVMAWVNDVAGNWLTATQVGDTTVKIVEDSASLDIIYKWKFKFVSQGQVISGGATKLWPYWSTQNPTSFEMFNDNVYMVNGDQRGVVWNGEIAHSYPLAAFGEPLVTPISLQSGENSAYVIDGEVRYALRHAFLRSAASVYTAGSFGPVSAPVKTKNGRFLLRNFALMPVDSLVDSTILIAGDTLTYTIYRTTSNPGRIDETMKLYNTDLRVRVINGDSVIVQDLTTGDTTKFASLASAVVIDSLPDSALANRDAIGVLALNNVWAGRDSLGVMNRRTGAPTFISGDTIGFDISDTAQHRIIDDTLSYGLFLGIPPQRDTLGFAYAVAPMDTLTGNEGPLSEWCVIYNDAIWSGMYAKLTIGLPPLPPNDSGIVYNLYRAMIYQVGEYAVGFDSSLNYDSVFNEWYNNRGETYQRRYNRITARKHFNAWWFGNENNRHSWIDPVYSVDTTILFYPFLVSQIPAVDTLYVDSMRYDSLELRRAYEQITPPARISRLVSYDNYLFGTDGLLLYRSQVDSASKWGFWDFTPFNTNDGDRVIDFWAVRGGMRVKQNFSSFTAFSEYSKMEINEGWGCIAPFSHIKGSAHYFMSFRGIEAESEGLYLERSVRSVPLSEPLSNFKERTMADLSQTVSFYVPDEQLALFSLGDTTYAYFEEAGRRTEGQGGWATWSMPFRGATLFDTEDELNFIPGKTMYFYQDDDNNIYRYGESTTDNGTNISMEWRSGAYGVDRWKDQVMNLGLWVNSTDDNDSVLTAYIYDQDGSKSDSVVFPTLSNRTYILKSFGDYSPTQWYQIGLSNSGTISNTKINMIDFTVNPKAQPTDVE